MKQKHEDKDYFAIAIMLIVAVVVLALLAIVTEIGILIYLGLSGNV